MYWHRNLKGVLFWNIDAKIFLSFPTLRILSLLCFSLVLQRGSCLCSHPRTCLHQFPKRSCLLTTSNPCWLLIFNYFISKIILDFLSNSFLKQNLLASTVILTKLKCVLRAAVDILTDTYDGCKGQSKWILSVTSMPRLTSPMGMYFWLVSQGCKTQYGPTWI